MEASQVPPVSVSTARSRDEAILASMPAWKKLLFAISICLAVFLAVELTVRIGAYFLFNRSPYFLLYGLKSVMADDDPEGHSVAGDGYFKFPPSRTLHQYGMFKEPTPIRINSAGLRGDDFAPERPADVFRIVALGESSTFGFYSRDEHTYPAVLEKLLAASFDSGSGIRPEVINAGIPHANSSNIAAMMRSEIVAYRPHLVTVYAGFNDAAHVADPTPLHRALRWTHGHIATYVALKRVVSALGGPELHSRWRVHTGGVDSSYIARQVQLHEEVYERNLREVISIARASGAQLVFIRQPVNDGWEQATAAIPYDAKVARARAKLASGGLLSESEALLLVHEPLMRILDRLALEHDVPVVDNIAIVDAHPEYFASYVHLTEPGNLALAGALRDTILALAPPALIAAKSGAAAVDQPSKNLVAGGRQP